MTGISSTSCGSIESRSAHRSTWRSVSSTKTTRILVYIYFEVHWSKPLKLYLPLWNRTSASAPILILSRWRHTVSLMAAAVWSHLFLCNCVCLIFSYCTRNGNADDAIICCRNEWKGPAKWWSLWRCINFIYRNLCLLISNKFMMCTMNEHVVLVSTAMAHIWNESVSELP